MTYLSHSSSFQICERIAPSNRGIKHLASGCFDRHKPIMSEETAGFV